MRYSQETIDIYAKILALEFVFQNFLMSLYDNMPNEIAYQKLSGVKDTILNEINKMPFPNADDQSAEKMRKAILKNARECIDGLLERYKASS